MQFIASLIALIFQGQTYEFQNVRNFQGALFVFLTNMTFQSVFGVINVRKNQENQKPIDNYKNLITTGHHFGTARFLTRAFQRNVQNGYLFSVQDHG